MPHLLICAGGSRNDGICFLLAAFGFAMNPGNRGSLISRPTGHIRMLFLLSACEPRIQLQQQVL